MPNSESSGVARVLIVGGGVAGVEAMLACRDLLGERAEIVIAAPRRDFVYKPFSVAEPFGSARVERFDLERVAEDRGARFQLGSVGRIDGAQRQAHLHDGGPPLDYDYLVIAAGVQLLWPFPGASTFWGVSDEADIQGVLNGAKQGAYRRIAFTVPGGHSWALPLYELALQTRTELDKAKVPDAEVLVVTPEEAPLQVFGRGASAGLSELLAASEIEVIAGAHPVRFQDGTLEVVPSRWISADAVVSMPRLEGRKIEGVPCDESGFVPTDDHGRILGLERGFAIGDITTFPVKQGGIATQQADLVAESIAADLGLGPQPARFDPVLRGVLWTGGKPRYLYGQIGGGHGENSGMSEEAPWPDHGAKIIGRYITPYLAEATEAATR